MTYDLKTTQNDGKMHYKLTIFGACAPYSRLYRLSCKKSEMTCHQNPGPVYKHCNLL